MKTIATDHLIDPKIVDAIITIESAWNPDAIRYEPDFRYTTSCPIHAKANGITEKTEERLQMFSFGLMQIMGATARLLGFEGTLLDLVDVETNIVWGCRYLKSQQKRYNVLSDVVAAYNAGSAKRNEDGRYKNQDYVNKFMSVYSGHVSPG